MKGQISLDLMLAVLVTLIVLGTLFAAVDSVKQSYQEVFIENQLKKISSEQAAFLTSINALSDVNVDIKLRAPFVYYENRKLNPNLKIVGDKVNASVDIDGKIIESSSSFSMPAGVVISYNKNKTLEVTKVA